MYGASTGTENLLVESETIEQEERAAEDGPKRDDSSESRARAAGKVDQAAAANVQTGNDEALLRQPPSKAVPLIAAALRNQEEDWVPLSIIGSHIHEANSEFDPRTYGCAKLADLLVKTGQFEVNRSESPVRARMKRLR